MRRDPSKTPRRAVVVGAGPVGCLAARLLAARGFTVEVVEKRPSFENGLSEEGRTINLSISPRGLAALQLSGVADEFAAMSVPMGYRIIHAINGACETTKYGTNDRQCHSVGRNALNLLLFRDARQHGVQFRFHTQAVELDSGARRLFFTDAAANTTEHSYDLLVGADGAFSTIRTQLAAAGAINASTSTLDLAYAELNLTSQGGGFLFESSAIHIWPRGGYFMIGLPNTDGTFKCTLVVPAEGSMSFSKMRAGGLASLLKVSFPDAYPYLDRAEEDTLDRPAGTITTVACDALHCGESVLLMGDAAHAIAPFLGQGINLGFEDCVVLDDLLARQGDDLAAICRAFTAERQPNVDAAAALSMANYRQLVRTDVRHMETSNAIGDVRDADPLVVMVNFLGLPYAEVQRRLMT